jgi:deoxyribodipyrimidine photolyase-related protein
MIKSWQEDLRVPVDILPDKRFLATHNDFAKWAMDKKQLRMEFFYREMRKKYNILIEPDGKPTGGAWNYDKENRKPPRASMNIPRRLHHKKSNITKSSMKQLILDEVITFHNEKFPILKKKSSNSFNNLKKSSSSKAYPGWVFIK